MSDKLHYDPGTDKWILTNRVHGLTNTMFAPFSCFSCNKTFATLAGGATRIVMHEDFELHCAECVRKGNNIKNRV